MTTGGYVLCKEKALHRSWNDRGWEMCKWMITGRSTFARKYKFNTDNDGAALVKLHDIKQLLAYTNQLGRYMSGEN